VSGTSVRNASEIEKRPEESRRTDYGTTYGWSELVAFSATSFKEFKGKPKKTYSKPSSARKPAERRRRQYVNVQALYKRSFRNCCQTVISGGWKNNEAVPLPEGMADYWETIFSQKSVHDSRDVVPKCEVRYDIWTPIGEAELDKALRTCAKTAPGPDGLSAKDLIGRYGLRELVKLVNSMMREGDIPEELKLSRTVFVPKGISPRTAGDFRPISITPVLTRAFHKVIAQRWLKAIGLSPYQLAFQKRDGCAEGVALINMLLNEVNEKRKELCMVVCDLSKAFDCVSHDSIVRAAQTFGAPPAMVKYLRHLYRDSSTKMCGRVASTGRGVKQGDPLSPLLFVMVMDMALGSCVGKSPYVMDSGHTIDHIMYADDLILCGTDHADLQERLNAVTNWFGSVGLTMNEGKCVSMEFRCSRKEKKVFVSNNPFTVHGKAIRTLKANDEFLYLGIPFNSKGAKPFNHAKHLEMWLSEIDRAPLKPYQRLRILRECVFPKCLHVGVLSQAHHKTLLKLDRMKEITFGSGLSYRRTFLVLCCTQRGRNPALKYQALCG